MSGKAKGQVKATVIKAADPVISAPVKKSDAPSQVTVEEAVNAGDWIEPPMMLEGLKNMVTESSILPQCIRAYKNNIAGFGIGIRYTVDQEETPEMKAEFDAITEVVELLNVDQDTKQVFENIVEARETYGIALSAVALGLYENGEMVFGVVYNPFTEELFHAAKGEGAYLNDRTIHVSDQTGFLSRVL